MILEGGFVNDLRSFAKIQPEIANLATVVSYDRAGLGLSEGISSLRWGVQIAGFARPLKTTTDTTTLRSRGAFSGKSGAWFSWTPCSRRMEVGSEEFLDWLENPFLALHRRLRAVCQLPGEVLLGSSLKGPLCHLCRLRLDLFNIFLALF